MMPSIHPGEIVIFKPTNKNKNPLLIRNGSVIVLQHPLLSNKVIIKRVYKVTSTGLEVRGDNAQSSTDSRQFGLVNTRQVLGVVEYIIK